MHSGDFIALEDKQQETAASNKGRFAQDTGDDDDISDDDRRVDMSAITGAKEREERREQFYSVQDKCKCNGLCEVGTRHKVVKITFQ